MKKQVICTNIRYAYLRNVDSIDGSTINLNAGEELKTLETEHAAITETLSKSAAGNRIKQVLKIKLAQQDTLNLLLDQEMIMEITTEEGDIKVMGSLNIPTVVNKMTGTPPVSDVDFIRYPLNFEFL